MSQLISRGGTLLPPGRDDNLDNAARRGAWVVLACAGLVLVLVGLLHLVPFVRIDLGNPEWEYWMSITFLGELDATLLGIALLFAAAIALRSRGLIYVPGFLSLLLIAGVLSAAFLLTRSAPTMLRKEIDSRNQWTMKRTIEQSYTRAALYTVGFSWIAFVAWRRAGRSGIVG